jgi:hypothetical protein
MVDKFQRGSVLVPLRTWGVSSRGYREVQEVLAMEAPESADSLAFCLVAEFGDGELLATEAFRQLRESQQLNQLAGAS